MNVRRPPPRCWTGCLTVWSPKEIDFGAPLPPGMASVLNSRLTPQAMRKTMLTAHRWTAPEALAAGFVDEVVAGDGEATITRALEFAETMKKHSASGVREAMWIECEPHTEPFLSEIAVPPNDEATHQHQRLVRSQEAGEHVEPSGSE